ncbi:MAG: hypothetical protein CMJ62_08595, partial [Planctomycetaceae bacterium]|nr:hypothetical protein [Planctomycetaceae bacterium]
FTLDDFAEQLRQMKNMGGMMSMLDKLPGSGGLHWSTRNRVSVDREISTQPLQASINHFGRLIFSLLATTLDAPTFCHDCVLAESSGSDHHRCDTRRGHAAGTRRALDISPGSILPLVFCPVAESPSPSLHAHLDANSLGFMQSQQRKL